MCPETWDNYRQLRIDSRIVFYNQSLQKINNTSGWTGAPTRTNGIKTNEPSHDKTHKMALSPSKHSDQPGHPPGLISLRCKREESLGPYSYPLIPQ